MTTAPLLLEDETDCPAVGSPVDRRVMRPVECRTVAALYVEPNGCYVGVPGVDPWDEARDARQYAGPHPVVAHPPCQRWGRFWHGSTRKPHQFKLGDDGGCFAAALAAVKRWGGVLEHPAHSKAWDAFGIRKPLPGAGWWWCPDHGVWVCHVEQGHYGHYSRKPTWLIAAHVHRNDLPELNWTKGEQRLPAWMVERYGYEKARRIGVVAMVGGKNKTAIRNATPIPFRDEVLLPIARKAHNAEITGASGLIAGVRVDGWVMPHYPRSAALENDMKIAEILNEHGNDFTARMECEHCGHTAKLTSGYHDNHYHTRVIPAMRCKECGKNRAGELEHTDAGVSPCAA